MRVGSEKERQNCAPCNGRTRGRSAGISGSLWLLIGVLGLPLAAQEAPVIAPRTILLHGGEDKDVYLNLGADNRPDIALKARLVLDGRWPDPDCLRLSIVRNSSQERARETVLRHTPGGRILWLEATVERCAKPGVYNATVEISAQEPEAGDGFRSVPIPLRMKIEESAAWWASSLGSFLIVLPLALLVFYGWTSINHSRFLSTSQLAEILRPHRWKEGGGTEPIERSTSAVRGRIETHLRFVDRAKAWLFANPLIFGLPFQTYEETVQILPGRSVEELFLIPVPVRRARHHFEKNPHRAKGHLFVTATSGTGPIVFGLPNNGRLGGLIPDKELDPHHVRNLGNIELRDSPDGARPLQPSGWRILQAQGRKGVRR